MQLETRNPKLRTFTSSNHIPQNRRLTAEDFHHRKQGLSPQNQVYSKVRQLARSTIEALKNPKSDVSGIAASEKDVHEFTKATARTLTLHMKDQGDGSKNDIAVLSVLSALRDIARHLGNIAVRIPSI